MIIKKNSWILHLVLLFLINLLLVKATTTRNPCALYSAVTEIAPINTNFSTNACIVEADYSVADCSKAAPDYFINDTAVLPCPGVEVTTAPVIDGGQIFYATMEQAIANCPYGLIQFTGTIYMTTIVDTLHFWYNQSIDLTIQGVPLIVEVPATNVTQLVNSSQTIFNTTTNTSETIIVQVPQVTSTNPAQTIQLLPILVGFRNLRIANDSINVWFDSFILEECEATSGVFLTEAQCDRCKTEQITYCQGAWFPKSRNVTYNGVCEQTGARFNATQHVSFQNNSVVRSDFYNGFSRADVEYFYFTDNFTLELWMNPTVGVDNTNKMVAGNRRRSEGSSVSQGWGIYYSTKQTGGFAKWAVSKPSKGEIYCPFVPPPGEWTHIAGTFSQGTVKLYVNGVLTCTTTGKYKTLTYNTPHAFNGGDGSRPFTVGGGWTDHNGDGGDSNDHFIGFNGMLDEVRVWNVVRTSTQIASQFQLIQSSLAANLVVYLRFDSDFGFKENWAKGVTGQPVPQFYVDIPAGGDILAIPDCFCTDLLSSCTPQLFVPTEPTIAVDSITSTDSINNYEFIQGEVIMPNGNYGMIWLAGRTSTAGPIYNQIVRFVPGMYYNYSDPLDNYTIRYDFIPGTNPSQLPPFYFAGDNKWLNYDFFMPGWFLNDGRPPFVAYNFYPGIFASINNSMVPLPVDWEAGDLIFNPGILFPNGTFVPYPVLDPYYAIPIIINQGIAFNATLDLDNCTNPGLTITNATLTIPVLETLLGCNVTANDIEPFNLDPTQRNPCFALRDIRKLLPFGTHALDPELVLGCTIGPDDPEPYSLDPYHRNPCFVLRDIRKLVPINETCPNGNPPHPRVYYPCLKNQNLTLTNLIVRNAYAEKVFCQYACDENVNLYAVNNTFENIPGNAIWSSGMENYNVHDNFFCPCGGMTDSCVYLNANHITTGSLVWYNNRHCAIEDLLPVSCTYDITPVLRCNQSQVMCLDIPDTLAAGCPQVQVSPGVYIYDSDCAVFAPCNCTAEQQILAMPDGSFLNITTFTGDMLIDTSITTPSLLAFSAGYDGIVELSCNTEIQNVTVDYPCQINVIINVTIGNVTISVPTLVDSNCSATVEMKVAVSSGLNIQCPCPSNYNSSSDTFLTGDAAYQYLGLYQTCSWPIPGGLPGETCTNGVVDCPYSGGTLGTGTPPPVGPNECDPSTGLAKILCSSCSGGFVTFEGYTYSCPSSCTAVNTTVTIFTVPCYCLDFTMTVACTRSLNCVNPTPCPANNTLCNYTGTLTWNGVPYPCYLLQNETDCVPLSYAAVNPTPPASGLMRIPCTDTYQIPSPGPCSCVPAVVSGNNISIACNVTADPNCTSVGNGASSGSTTSSSQLICQPQGYIKCRCDGIQAINPFAGKNFTLNPRAAAFHIDHVPDGAYYFQQNNVAQQLPIGVRYERITRIPIEKYPLRVQHFWTDWFVLAESQALSPWITGTEFDWVYGQEEQWDFINCSYVYPMTPDNHCKQYRPTESQSCVVDQTYDPLQTDGFGVVRYNQIVNAVKNCPVNNIIIRKSANVYEEQIITDRSNLVIISYDGAVIVSDGNVFTGDNNTIRGLTMIHTATSHAPMIQPGKATSNYLSALFDPDRIDGPPNYFRFYNNRFIGGNVNDAGVMVGLFGQHVDFSFNVIENFYTRAVYIDTPSINVQSNTFIRCPGRPLMIKNFKSLIGTKNSFLDCVGIKVAKNMEIVSLRAYGDIGKINKNAIDSVLYQSLTVQQYLEAFNVAKSLSDLSPDLGCNATYDSSRLCAWRGNQIVFGDTLNTAQLSTVCYSFRGGAWDLENITDNACNFGRLGIAFSYTPRINYLNASEVMKRNFFVQPVLTQSSSITDGADFVSVPVGSLTGLACSMPDCINEQWPNLESNPRCDFAITPQYGFTCINNVTAASKYGKVLNLVNVTSGQARIRRDNLYFARDTFAVGNTDYFCCDLPVIYANTHTFATEISVLETIELRYELDPQDSDPDGDLFLQTPPDYVAQQIRLLGMRFDGRYKIGTSLLEIANVHIDPATGVFQLQDSSVYNWWHYPLNTVRGVLKSAKGDSNVVVIPEFDVVYYENRAPNVNGFNIYFQTYERITTSRYVRKTTFNPLAMPDSMCIIVNNTWKNIDGRALLVSSPGNWEVNNNTFLDCGMRHQYSSHMIKLEGNMDSTGDYYFNYNFVNQSIPYLWAFTGGKNNRVRVSAVEITDLLFPLRFEIKDNTVVHNAPEDYGVILVDNSVKKEYPGDYGFFKKDGPKIFGGAIKFSIEHPKPFSKTAEGILGRSVKSSDITGGVGSVQEGLAYRELSDGTISLDNEGIIEVTPNTYPYGGYTIALRINVPPDVIYKGISATNIPAVYTFLQDPGLVPLGVVARENFWDTARQYLAVGQPLPINIHKGFKGINADIVSCFGFKDRYESSLQECNTCNRGCPVIPPPACLIDPKNASFVPENPYYNTWYFVTLKEALMFCANPRREIWMYDQTLQVTENFYFDTGNWTIRSKGENKTRVSVSISVVFAADNITLDSFAFYHDMGNLAPTMITDGNMRSYITIINCTFFGMNTTRSAVFGDFASLAVVNGTFIGYIYSEKVLWISSNCGMLVVQNNTFFDVHQTTVYASNFNVINSYHNRFQNCGGKSLSMFYVSVCKETSTHVIFSKNRHYKHGYVTNSFPHGHVAAYWLDGIPLTNTTQHHLNLRGNTAEGLDIGIRITNTDDLNAVGGGLTMNTRATVFDVCVQWANVDCIGEWHYVVWGNPPFDASIDADPAAHIKYWCDADCDTGNGVTLAIIIIGALGGLAILVLFIHCRFCLYNSIDRKLTYSSFLQESVSIDNPRLNPERKKRYGGEDFLTSIIDKRYPQ
jgi:ferredoxin